MQNIKKQHKYFETQAEGEEVLIITRRHWIIYLPSFILGIFVSAFSLTILTNIESYSFFDNDSIRALIICVFSLILLFTTLFVYIGWLINYLNIQIVTNEHIVDIDQLGLFNRKVSALCLDEIQDVTAHQKGVFQSLFSYGNVVVQTAGELPNFTFEKVKDPYGVSKKIMEIKDKYADQIRQRRRGRVLGKTA